ncbi:hypothetical protein BYT27DRAFT_7254442 [Phlegmacium glaucopus]|nr:hypothetical protein BYT27DRAFT_7254442 [Phlegmacium glaucopus]
MLLHVSYKEWLKLMLVYFDVVNILGQYVAGSQFPFKTIKIEILVTPLVSNDSLPWRELFTYSNIFSTKGVPVNEHRFTREFICNHFETAAGANLAQSHTWAKKAQHGWNTGNIQEINTHLKHLAEKSTVPGWRECAGDLQSKLKNKMTLDMDADSWIIDTIELLLKSKNYTFPKFLHDADEKGLHFFGMQHCEASLASLLKDSKGGTTVGYEDIRAQLEGFGRVLGVSKCCCPTCEFLLSLLTKGQPPLYLVIGSHSSVMACTPPPWLPADIVDSMNVFFGGKLRQELIMLMDHPLMRGCTTSTGSRRISSESGIAFGGTSNIIPIRANTQNAAVTRPS